VKLLDSALAQAETPEEIVVYRGLNPTAALGMLGQTPRDVASGTTFRDRGFVSTSLLKNEAEQFVSMRPGGRGYLMQVTVPAGSNGAYLNADVPDAEEHEFLLPRGASFRFDSLTSGSGKINGIINVTYLGSS
jgi:hypothetical protein